MSIQVEAGSKYVKHAVAARFHGVHTITIDRWVRAGILPKPVVINGLKYHNVEALAAAGVKRG
jgi:predicted site-specific integrase-resolvase